MTLIYLLPQYLLDFASCVILFARARIREKNIASLALSFDHKSQLLSYNFRLAIIRDANHQSRARRLRAERIAGGVIEVFEWGISILSSRRPSAPPRLFLLLAHPAAPGGTIPISRIIIRACIYSGVMCVYSPIESRVITANGSFPTFPGIRLGTPGVLDPRECGAPRSYRGRR